MNIDNCLKYSISRIKLALYVDRLNFLSGKSANAKRHIKYNEAQRLKYRKLRIKCNDVQELEKIDLFLDCAYNRKLYWENKLKKISNSKKIYNDKFYKELDCYSKYQNEY